MEPIPEQSYKIPVVNTSVQKQSCCGDDGDDIEASHYDRPEHQVIDDSSYEQKKNQQDDYNNDLNVKQNNTHHARLISLLLGIVILALIGFGTYYFVVRKLNLQFSSQQNNNISNGITTNISLQQVQEHSINTDCWMVLHNNVYDLTDYIKKHPGGQDWILSNCGTDATSKYQQFHAKSLLKKVSNMQVGILFDDTSVAAMNDGTTNQGDNSNSSNNNNIPTNSFQSDATTTTSANSSNDLDSDDDDDDDSDDSDNTSNESTTTNNNNNNSNNNNSSSNANGSGTTPNNNDCFPVEQVALHANQNDCYVVLYGKVYDFTNYVNRHPGGPSLIIHTCGSTNATVIYETGKNHNLNLLNQRATQYYLGQVC